jgi:hypothetical protein
VTGAIFKKLQINILIILRHEKYYLRVGVYSYFIIALGIKKGGTV